MNERHGYVAESAVFCAVMQWLLFAFTLIVMALLQRLARGFGGPLAAYATLALGCLTLAAVIAGTIAHRLRLPRIVGYLVAGFAIGPAWLRIVHREELQALSVVSSGALALIAFAVGNELTFDALRPERRAALLRIAAGAMAVPFAAVAFVVLTISPWFPLTAHQPFRDALVVALALGTMAAVSSPTLTWAVITDAGARGEAPLSRATLDVSVIQDVTAVVLLIVVLGLARVLASGGAVLPGVTAEALSLVAGSIAVGIGLGFATTQYLRRIRGSLVWVLVILAFIVAQAVRLLGLDAVLIALAAGSTLRNVAAVDAERIKAELKRCAIPVYVVFFALAGSNLQLDALNEMWAWALLFAGLRVTGLWGGVRLARRLDSAVSADWVDYGWLGLVSQGGLALTLAAMFRRAFPQWNVSLEALLVAMIGVHQLAGPICFRWVLKRAGEITEEVSTEEAEPVAVGGSVGGDGGGGGARGARLQ
jgi:Kef-type K+ transport system membrane component KefB